MPSDGLELFASPSPAFCEVFYFVVSLPRGRNCKTQELVHFETRHQELCFTFFFTFTSHRYVCSTKMNVKGRAYSKKYRKIQSEIIKLLASTEPSSTDLAVSDISDFHVGDVLAYRENVSDVTSADRSKTLPLNIELARWAARHNLFYLMICF